MRGRIQQLIEARQAVIAATSPAPPSRETVAERCWDDLMNGDPEVSAKGYWGCITIVKLACAGLHDRDKFVLRGRTMPDFAVIDTLTDLVIAFLEGKLPRFNPRYLGRICRLRMIDHLRKCYRSWQYYEVQIGDGAEWIPEAGTKMPAKATPPSQIKY